MSTNQKLNTWKATAISGNDITSSCLYVSAITIAMAGQYAWIALLIVAAVLFLFRKIYGEVVGALPLNGGAYNVLLNTTSKSNASIAACLTILSYMATAVISASEAIHYLHHSIPQIHIFLATLLLLFFFLCLTIAGISESAIVALVIFIIHMASMALLVISAIYFLVTHGISVLIDNFSLPIRGGSFGTALFFGFSAALLGISGFESSANFVEEQEKGVFPKTLRNMWLAVSILNPLIAFLAIGVMPISEVDAYQQSLLSHMASLTGGQWLATIISFNAVLVLSGAVLTSFVGVNGLIKRMTLDRVLPQFLLKENKRGSSYRILITFFLLCVSVLLVTKGALGPLAGVYTISFLLVMIFFALGNLILKIRRSRLPRPEYASQLFVVIALAGVSIGLYGNIKMHPEYLVVFLQYFIPTMLLIYAMLNRNHIMEFVLTILKSITTELRKLSLLSHLVINKFLDKLHEQDFVFFSKGDDIATLNKVMIYLQENEITRKIRIVTVLSEHQPPPEQFLKDFEVLDRAYPEIKMEYITLEGEFGPQLIDQLSNEWKIPKNLMFFSSPADTFSYVLEESGGVRLFCWYTAFKKLDFW
ncbi:MAG: APC family permease [Chitinophagaceae bacterium]|nr:APC family permease [Chitinophagaceae bacterium]